VDGAIEKSPELELSDSELVAVEDEPAARVVRAA
jgi:hypothetical protein